MQWDVSIYKMFYLSIKVLIPTGKARECDDIILRSGISVILFNDQRNDVSLINSLAEDARSNRYAKASETR